MSYYRKFIRNFASIAAPHTDLTKQKRGDKSARQIKSESNTPWEDGIWTNTHQRAFETLKGALLTRPVLTPPNHKWRLATDASNAALGAVLSQVNDQNEEHPIGYFSHKISGSWATEMEHLGVRASSGSVGYHCMSQLPQCILSSSRIAR